MSEGKYIQMRIKRQAKKYIKSSKQEKGKILSRLEEDTGKHRKSLIRALNRQAKQPTNQIENRGRPKKYNQHSLNLVKLIWEANDYICAERITQKTIKDTLKDLKEVEELNYFSKEECAKIESIPLGSLKMLINRLPKIKTKYSKKGGSSQQKSIPIRTRFNRDTKAGYLGLDFVDHNGGDPSGQFVRTLQATDPKTTWISRAACLNKHKVTVEKTFDLVHKKIPYEVRGLHTDNERSLLSSLLKAKAENENIFISRTRSYEFRDNAHVEQKNGDKVRNLVGYRRYDLQEQVVLLNQIYHIDDLYQNHFIASVRLVEKEYNELGKLVKKTYSKPKTAFERAIQEPSISQERKEKLKKQHEGLNRVKLKRKRDKLIRKLQSVG